jgi:hypothetical protein
VGTLATDARKRLAILEQAIFVIAVRVALALFLFLYE